MFWMIILQLAAPTLRRLSEWNRDVCSEYQLPCSCYLFSGVNSFICHFLSSPLELALQELNKLLLNKETPLKWGIVSGRHFRDYYPAGTVLVWCRTTVHLHVTPTREGVITIHYLCCKFMLVNIFACIEDTSMLYKRVMTTLSDDLLCVAPCTSQWKSITILLCKAEKQYLVSCKVSRYVFGFARQGPIPQKILKLGLSWLDYTRHSSW